MLFRLTATAPRLRGVASVLTGLLLLAFVSVTQAGQAGAEQGLTAVHPSDLVTSEGLRATVFGIAPELLADLPSDVPAREYNLLIEGNRPVPDLFWFNRRLRVWFSAQPGPAPLVVAIAGTGGDGNTAKLRLLRRALYGAGYHVLTLPSPTFPGFVTAASSTGVAGDLQQDSADLLRVLKQVLAQLPPEVDVAGVHVIGYSLGGAHAAVMKALDRGPDAIGLQRAVMLNPPVDLFASIARIDRMFADHIGQNQAEIERFYRRLFANLAEVYQEAEALAMDEAFLLKAASRLLSTDDEFSAAIALSFRLSLINMFFAGDYYAGTGVVVDPDDPPAASDPLDREFTRLRAKPFREYVEQVFLPFYLRREAGLESDELIGRNRLHFFEEELARDPDYFVQHNEDDFILDSTELAWLRQTLGPRMVTYARGGHLGNLGERQQIEDLLTMLAGDWRGERTHAGRRAEGSDDHAVAERRQ